MTSQVIFKIDSKLKAKAMKRARRAGLPFASILKLTTQAYAEGRLNVDISEPRQLNDKTRELLKRELQEIKEGKNLSPVFDNAKEAIAYLKNL